MQKQLKLINKYLFLFLIGGLIYVSIELIYRGHSHWTMGVLGGVSFISIGLINEILSWETPLLIQCAIGGCLITFYEFITGLILNIWLHLGIWDYSHMPFNILGQICLPFTLIWCILSLVAIILDDYIRFWFFNEEKPNYKLFYTMILYITIGILEINLVSLFFTILI